MPLSRTTLKRLVGILCLAIVVWFFPEMKRETWLSLGLSPDTSEVTSPAEMEAVVERVVDGDTFVLVGGERVRLIGVDTPESVKSGSPVECFGPAASTFLKELIAGKTVRLVRDVSDRDRYGRLLRYAYLGDTFINETLVRSGYATVATFPPDVRELEKFRVAEREARTAQVGLWDPTRCPGT